MDRLMTFEEVASALAVSARTIYRMIDRGQLPVVRVTPDAPRIRASTVHALITRGSAETAEASPSAMLAPLGVEGSPHQA